MWRIHFFCGTISSRAWESRNDFITSISIWKFDQYGRVVFSSDNYPAGILVYHPEYANFTK